MPFRQQSERCGLCDVEIFESPQLAGGLRLCAPCYAGRNAARLLARGVRIQTVEYTAVDVDGRETRAYALGKADDQLALQARFGWEGWLSRRRRDDILTGDKQFDDAIRVEGDGEILPRLLEHAPVRRAIRDMVGLGTIRIDRGIVIARAAQENLERLRLAVTAIAWGLGQVAKGSSAAWHASDSVLPWPDVLATHIESLAISGDRFDPRQVAAVPSLQALTLSDLVLTSGDLGPLGCLTELQTLRLLRINEVRDLASLDWMPCLTAADLAGCPVADVTPLARFSGLERLDLSQTQVTDLTPLAGLPELKELYLAGTSIDSTQLATLRAGNPALRIGT